MNTIASMLGENNAQIFILLSVPQSSQFFPSYALGKLSASWKSYCPQMNIEEDFFFYQMETVVYILIILLTLSYPYNIVFSLDYVVQLKIKRQQDDRTSRHLLLLDKSFELLEKMSVLSLKYALL